VSAPFHPIQTAFAGGELNERLRGRVDLEIYKKGLAYCENWEPNAEGSLRMRPPTRLGATHLAPVGFGGSSGILGELFSLPRAGDNGWIAELREDAIFIRDADQLLDGDGVVVDAEAEVVLNPYYGGAPLTNWTNGTYAAPQTDSNRIPETSTPPDWDVDGHHVAMLGDRGWLKQTLTVAVAGDYDFSFFYNVNGSGATGLMVTIGTADNGSDIFSENVDNVGQAHFYTWYTKIHRPLTLAAGTYYLKFEVLGEYPDNAHIGGVSLRNPQGMDSIHTATDVWVDAGYNIGNDVCVVPFPGQSTKVVLLRSDVAPYELKFNAWSRWELTLITFTSTPSDWNKEGDWPSCGCYYQGRLYLGHTVAVPAGIWASRPNDPYNFTIDDPVVDNSAIEFKLSSKGAIRWITGRQSLLIGTDIGEHSITGSGGVISPLDFNILDESDFGSAPVAPVTVGIQALYAGRDARRVRAINYAREQGAWSSQDISITGAHLFNGNKILKLLYLRDPDGVAIAYLDTGELLACCYDREKGVAAWWRLTLAAGGSDAVSVKACCVAESEQGSLLWMLVQRGTAPNVARSLEYLSFAEPEVEASGYLDCMIETVAVALSPTACGVYVNYALGGDDPFEGREVDVVVAHGGVLYSQKGLLVLSQYSEQITVPVSAGDLVYVGHAYTPRAETLPPSGNSQTGTMETNIRRWPRIILRVNRSAPPLVDGERPTLRRKKTVVPVNGTLLNEDLLANSKLGHETEGKVTITQDLPFRTEVLAVFGSVSASEV
jgi:hypothetical protein